MFIPLKVFLLGFEKFSCLPEVLFFILFCYSIYACLIVSASNIPK